MNNALGLIGFMASMAAKYKSPATTMTQDLTMLNGIRHKSICFLNTCIAQLDSHMNLPNEISHVQHKPV